MVEAMRGRREIENLEGGSAAGVSRHHQEMLRSIGGSAYVESIIS
ncbi:MAG TPA: hypothetical protein VM537_31520 [Anaerolineae bacterium]|jgi:hypothetical protein|nr:hypothetical protein [Anaerolineae bacterium]